MKHLFRVLAIFAALVLLTGAGAARAVDNNPHGPLNLACSACHTTAGWSELKPKPDFDHQRTAFPLTGRHRGVRCAACHTSLVFRDAGTQCADCHLDVHRGQFARACTDCHTPEQWRDEAEWFRRHQQTRFPLTGVHAAVDCQQCHQNGQFTGLSTECAGCHLDDYRNADTPGHLAAGFSTNCTECHNLTSRGWRGAAFDHAITGFALAGGHARATCSQCHLTNNHADASPECYTCHGTDFAGADDPDHEGGQFSHECQTCHTVQGWRPATFDHNLSGFPLTGAHGQTSCSECHMNGQYTGTSTVCYDCHRAAYESSDNPDHAASNFPTGCADCHTTSGWAPAEFDHNLALFPLTGAHLAVSCADCHSGGQYTGTPQECYGCHRDNFEGVQDPNHVAGQFDHDCTVCHSTTAWTPSSFNHANTDFPLTGAHAAANCAQCHGDGVYNGKPTQCYACHQADFEGVQDPNHVANQFSHDCATCHTTSAWEPATFNHNNTDFPLTGAHVQANCAECHVNGQYAGTPTDCWSCHQDDYADADDHVSGNFPHDCTLCHNTNDWDEGGGFNHAGTDFPLTGAHTAVTCGQCHADGQYDGRSTACYSCHQGDYEGVTDPNHVAGQFSHDCQSCHTTAAWQPASFDHSTTDFPLTGAHVSASCAACHVNGQFAGTPTDCFTCHESDFNGAADPNHAAGQFPHACAQCHNTTAWEPSTFNHGNTVFPLTGAHAAVSCSQCHVNGQFAGTPTDCWACHQADYAGVTDPNHVAGQFSHNCTECHTTTAWSPATFNHNNTDFPLTGAHVSASCSQCHIGGQYEGTPTDCFFCHQSDYNGTTNPNHAAAGFPTTCATCHNTTNWNAQFNHDGLYFPIYSGRHQGEWDQCSDCHTNPNNFAVFSCITCHEHNRTDMDNEHDEVSGYVYESSACFACHPDGNAGDGPHYLRDPRRER